MPEYEYGPDVELRYEVVGAGPDIREVIAAIRCPSCGADWQPKGSHRLGHHGGREVLCWACMRFHHARSVAVRPK